MREHFLSIFEQLKLNDMNHIDKKKLFYLGLFRRSAVFFPFLAAGLRLIFSKTMSIQDLQLDLICSCSAFFIFYFIMDCPVIGKVLISLLLFSGLLNAVLPLMKYGFWGKTAFTLISFSLISLPLPICIFASMKAHLKNAGGLYSSFIGHEVMLNRMRDALALIYQPVAVLILFFIIYQDAPVFLNILFTASLFILYILLAVRSITSSAWIENERKEENFFRDIKEVTMTDKCLEINNGYKVLFERMCSKMNEEKLFLSPSFTVEDLSKALYTNRGYLSRMINSCTGMNFNMLINDYRIKYAMALFKSDPDMKVSELMGLSGFNNPVSFNNAFKLIMKMPPGEWCNLYREELSRLKKNADMSSSDPPV